MAAKKKVIILRKRISLRRRRRHFGSNHPLIVLVSCREVENLGYLLHAPPRTLHNDVSY